MPDLVRLPAGTPLADIHAVLMRDGALILTDVVPAPQIDALRAELAPYVEATPTGRDPFSGTLTTRTGALVARSPLSHPLIMHPLVLGLCDLVLKPFCERYQLHLTQVIRILPGQGAQPIHRDRWAWGTHLAHLEPQLNTIWALTPFTAANGATIVAPGSLAWPDDRAVAAHETCQAVMSPGSVLIYTGGVFHGGGANASDAARVGLNLTYTLGWLRQEENQYLSCPPEIARTLPPELARLVGYQAGSFALGYYSPPLPPGAGPEIVGPDYALHGAGAANQLGAEDLLRAIAEKTGRGAALDR